MRGIRRIGGALPLVALTCGLLAACTSNPVGAVVTPSATPSAPPPVVTPAPTPTTPPPTQSAADATPVDLRCADLVPKDVARTLAPELTRVKDWTPTAGTPAAQLADLKGTACAWTDAAGDMLEVAVAEPSRKDATQLKNDLVRRSNSVPTYGGEAYFQIVDHVGRVDAFRGRTWISARSNRFLEPGDAAGVVASVDAAAGTSPVTASPTPTAEPTPSPAPTS
ncbi:hypothetical protein [Amnibacterium endophyticum]|uniref:DUF3558 domain-containing protein n=1 Tax=Amnibacterium endophyticum TaxID=2109337 RepID=A0ABW4LG19_9MICO